MIDERARQSDALGHPSRKMMRIGVGERFEADQFEKLEDFGFFLVKQPTGNEAGLDIFSNGQPGKKVWILKNQTALGARFRDELIVEPRFAGIGGVQAGDQAEQGGLSATAGSDQRHQRALCELEADAFQGKNMQIISRSAFEAFGNPLNTQGGAFRPRRYHLITPFCQTRTRSRTLKSSVMMVEKNTAMITNAA